jgi:hypothetical protein
VNNLLDTSPPPALGDLMHEVRQPVLPIQARGGHEDETLNAAYEARAGGAVSRWVVAAGGHTGALASRPGEYERGVIGFLDHALTS